MEENMKKLTSLILIVTLVKKISQIADYEGRSSNSHVLCLIRDNIKSFENEDGEIK